MDTGTSPSTLNLRHKWVKVPKMPLILQEISGKDELLCFIQPLLADMGDGFQMEEFLFAPNCDCNFVGRDLMPKFEIQINIIKRDTEAGSAVPLCQMSGNAYAEVKPEVQAAPGKEGK